MSDHAPETTAGKLSPMKYDEVKARAKKILERRGPPPYTTETYGQSKHLGSSELVSVDCLIDEEAAVLNDFMAYWMPLITGENSND